MGATRDDFIKYPRTPHLFGSKGTDDDKHLGRKESEAFIADPSLIVEEKIDGTNVGIHFTSRGRMVCDCSNAPTGSTGPWCRINSWKERRFGRKKSFRRKPAILRQRSTEGSLSWQHTSKEQIVNTSLWSDITRATNSQILAWAETQPWARDMAACGQDAQWHAEGDVWTHTRMVGAELERLAEWPSLGRADQLKLLFTALFHDSGKPATTVLDPETGRTRSPRHALVGAEIARGALRGLECDLVTREAIAALVRHHGRPPYLLEKENPEREVISLSWLVNNRLLYLFALADTRGRQAKEMSRPEENLHLWKLVAEEHNCFIRPYPFVNGQARFLFYRDQLSSLHYRPHEKYRCRVTLMSGLPGAGKDTWLARQKADLPVVSLDAVRMELDIEATDNQGEVIQTAREQCREHLRTGRDFAFNATNTMALTRRRWIDLFADYGARIEIVYLEPPLQTIVQQNKHRRHPVPESVIARLFHKLEPPTMAEAHEVIFQPEPLNHVPQQTH